MSAASRAEARRKAILSRGTDRLAKLTTSARGEDAPAYMHDDPPLPKIDSGLRSAVDEASTTPSLRRSSRSPAPLYFEEASVNGTSSDPSVWPQEQQQLLLRALMGGGPTPSFPGQSGSSPPSLEGESQFPTGDPLQAVMSQLSNFQSGADTAGKAPATIPTPKLQTRLQKFMPVFHLVMFWSLLAYFVLWKEPESFAGFTYHAPLTERWAELGWRGAKDWGVQVMPFFWAFVSLQLTLHSLRIFSGSDSVEPPLLLSVVLPHLPSPFPTVIVGGLKYLHMVGALLDDLAGVIFGFGFIIFIAGCLIS